MSSAHTQQVSGTSYTTRMLFTLFLGQMPK